jgi:hypothetical protein
MIEMFATPVEGSRTSKGIAWEATATLTGRSYSARSRHGAPNALARELVATSIPDSPVTVRYAGTAGCMTWRSLHRMAGCTYSEGNAPLHRTRWVEHPGISINGAASGDAVIEGTTSALRLPTPTENGAVGAPQFICDNCRQPFTAKRINARLCSTRCRKQASRKAAA